MAITMPKLSPAVETPEASWAKEVAPCVRLFSPRATRIAHMSV